jgi:UDP-N-acetylglucosamine diphosphorylase/glucosamine-1-phosphate N-acetyltransferase
VHDVTFRLFDEKVFKKCNIVLFEDGRTAEELFPLAVVRPSWEIRSGAGCTRFWLASLSELGSSIILRPRAELRAISAQLAGVDSEEFNPKLDTIFLNGRVFGFWRKESGSTSLPPNAITDVNGRLLFCRLKGSQVKEVLNFTGTELTNKLVEMTVTDEGIPADWKVCYAKHVWDFMADNPDILHRQLGDFGLSQDVLLGARALRDLPVGVAQNDPSGHRIYIGKDVNIMPGVVFGNHNGPILIRDNTEIEPHTYLDGPLYIGPNCRIKAGCRIYNGSSLGPHCRVAGEISSSILQGYVNKQHEGFLGNSHLGQWTNLGADTTNSNLRNDYGNVKVQVGSGLVESGRQFVGLLCGDYTRTGINTMFNTGTVAGLGANIYGAGFPPRFVGSFMWGGAEGLKPTSLERTLTSVRIAMSRRGQELTEYEEQLIRLHYTETVKEENRS